VKKDGGRATKRAGRREWATGAREPTALRPSGLRTEAEAAADTAASRRGCGQQPAICVTSRAAEGRVDRFLAREAGISRTEAQRWIEAGGVTIDGERAEASDLVRAGARVEAIPLAPEPTDLEPDASVPMEILHVDDALVVLVKPAGVVVHPAPGAEHHTLVHGLIARGLFHVEGDEPRSGRDRRPGIVHRLDKGTSGVMVVARTPEAREALKSQFAAHTIEREYVAICVGLAKTATHRTLHGRDPRDRKRFTSRVRTGKTAVTHVFCMESLPRGAARPVASLVRATLETGRTHQIRMHLAEAGTPVLGDPVYGKRAADPRVARVARELGHQALHARVLGFVHPTTQKRVHFESPPPADFARALEELRRC
jgi:23S rRNA pseudouridine1911/1915/1917 synthase